MARSRKFPESADKLDGVVKAAILLVHLTQDVASDLLTRLPADRVEEVTRSVASLGDVPQSLSAAVIEEFYTMRMARQYAKTGGMEYARQLLQQTLEPQDASRMIALIQTQVQKTPFSFLAKAESENLLTFIHEEHPQTIALIVSHLPYHRASEMLVGLSPQKQIEVVRRIAAMERANPEVIKEVENGLELRLASMLGQATDKVGGVETVAEILNLCDRATEKSIMEGVETDDPDLVEEIRRLMFVFEDILMVDDRGIQSVLKEVDNDELALSLKTASDDLKQKVLSNMSARASELIVEEMEYMGPVRVSDVENAQQRIVDVVRRLEEAGELIVAGRGGDQDELIV